MRKSIVILLLLCFCCKPEKIEKMAVYVPDTNTFSLQDVINAVEDHAGDIPDNLNACISNSIYAYFDPNYNNDGYAVDSSLKRFRNYGPAEILVPEGFSPNGDGVNDYFEVANLNRYPVHAMTIFAPPGGVNYGGGFLPGGTTIYYRANDYDEHPWDGTYDGYDMPETTYVWDLDINGSNYDNGTFYLAR